MDFTTSILFLLFGFGWICSWLPFMRSGLGGLVIALIIGFIHALSMIFQSTEIVMSMNGAREVNEQTAPTPLSCCGRYGYGGANPYATRLHHR